MCIRVRLTISWHWSVDAPDSKVHGANMGPTWVLAAPDEPHVRPMNFVIRGVGAEHATTHCCRTDGHVLIFRAMGIIWVFPTPKDTGRLRCLRCNWNHGISRLSPATRCPSAGPPDFKERLEMVLQCPWEVWSRSRRVAKVAGSRTSKIQHFPYFINISHICLRNNCCHIFFIHNEHMHLLAFPSLDICLFGICVKFQTNLEVHS